MKPKVWGPCPFCGDQVIPCTISSSAGVRRFSLCCGIELKFIKQFKTFSKLPQKKQAALLQESKAKLEAIEREEHRIVEKFIVSREALAKKYPENLAALVKGDR